MGPDLLLIFLLMKKWALEKKSFFGPPSVVLLKRHMLKMRQGGVGTFSRILGREIWPRKSNFLTPFWERTWLAVSHFVRALKNSLGKKAFRKKMPNEVLIFAIFRRDNNVIKMQGRGKSRISKTWHHPERKKNISIFSQVFSQRRSCSF